MKNLFCFVIALLAFALLNVISNGQAMTFAGGRSLRSFARPTSIPSSNQTNNQSTGERSRSWPNLRFMRTFFRAREVESKSSHIKPSIVSNAAFVNEEKLTNSIRDTSNKHFALSAPQAGTTSSAASSASNSYIDWSKFRPRLSSVLSFETNSSTAILPTGGFSSYEVQADNRKKEDDDKETSTTGSGFTNYLSSWWNGSGSSSGDRQLSAAASSSSAGTPSTSGTGDVEPDAASIIDHKNGLNGPSGSQLDIRPPTSGSISTSILPAHEAHVSFYHNAALIASGSIKALLCDKTMAIIRPDAYNSAILNDCELFDLDKRKKEADDLLKKLNLVGQTVNFEEMMTIIDKCRQLSERQIPSNLQPNQLDQTNSAGLQLASSDNKTSSLIWNGIVPGTLWCGLGDSAKHYDDLGPRQDIDVCCRAHDHCPVRLKSFRPGYGLFNLSFYTKSHCKCDRDFFQCLRKINNRVSNMIGNVFFNVLKVQCIDEEQTCLQYKETNGKKECLLSKSMMQIKQPESKY